jgi:hypothetical protein
VKISCRGHKRLVWRSLDLGWLDEVLRRRFRVQGPPNEGPRRRSRDEGPGRELIRVCKIKVGEREALALMLLALYIGNNNLQATPWWGRISQATTLTPIGPLQGEVGSCSIWAPSTVAPLLLGYGWYYVT